ncbi:MAG TPA: sodium:solute symporter family protein [Gemmatimonadales bacterium]|jgi:SSS family solute:Na+ symporter/sodium/proline symporter|nr:sodium:solute symporter family protein [Gemmatimonadales bacterium]
MNFYLAVILGYLTLLVLVGAYKTRQVKTQEDFAIAGRRLGVFVLICTLVTTWIGSGSLLGDAGLQYRVGIAGLWSTLAAACGIFLLYFIAPRARAFGQVTVPDILEARYNVTARLLGVVVTVIAYVTIVSYQYRGGGYVLNLVTDGAVSEVQGRIITAAFVIAYTVLAGMLSVAYTDILNGVFLTLGILVTLGYEVSQAGGFAEIFAKLPPSHAQFIGGGVDLGSSTTIFSDTLSFGQGMQFFLPGLFLLLGEAGMYNRFFSAKDAGAARVATVWWIVGVVILQAALCFLAIAGSALFPEARPEQIIPYMAVHGSVPIVGALLVAAMVAIIVSTADGFLLVPATNLMRDVYERFVNPAATDKQKLLFSRGLVVALGVIAYLLIQLFPSVLRAAYTAYTMYGFGVTPAILAAFLWKRVTTAGGVASIVGGMVATIVWVIAGRLVGHDPFGIDVAFPAMAASITLLIAVSLATPAEEKWRPFFQAP